MIVTKFNTFEPQQLGTCCNCGGEAVHRHHIVPRVLGGNDIDSNLADLCEVCHGLVHDMNFIKSRELQAEGIKRAKAEGKYKGRVPTAMRQAGKVKDLAEAGVSRVQIMEQLDISKASYYRCLGGIKRAKAEGKYKGRVPSAMKQADKVKALAEAGVGRVQIMEQLGMSKASYYRCLRLNND